MQYAPTRVHPKFGGFHIPAHGHPKNAPDFTIPNRGAPKTGPILDPNLRRRFFRGVCNTPLHGYMKNLAGFTFPHPDAPKNAPDFTLPNKDTPKTCPILGANPCRRTFRGVCFCALHGYTQKIVWFHISAHGYTKNAPGFIFPHTDTPKTHPVSYFPIGIPQKPARFYTQTFGEEHLGAYAFAPLHGYVQNLAGFIFPHPDTPKTHPISLSPIKGT